jgi:hypothetical protein
MSRVILSRYWNGQEKVVVGWDHPANGAFWQEFNEETVDPITGKINYPDEEVSRYGGMWPGIPLNQLIASMPEDLVPLMTTKVMVLLAEHKMDPESGRIMVDLSHDVKTIESDVPDALEQIESALFNQEG